MSDHFKGTVLNHPAGLFTLFFTEMWERFSYYGMRAILVLFLTRSLMEGGWAWERSEALYLYALYTGFVYFTPLFGGMLADKLLGYRKAIIIGAFTMAAGHMFMAFETPMFFYLGLTALIIGNGLFKPNISSIVGQLYDDEDKKDAAYTIFYMGINAGAFLGILLCGYIGEKVGWSYGFGLAMIFMIAGAVQFWMSGNIFGSIGLAPTDDGVADTGIADNISTPLDTQMSKRLGIATALFIGVALIIHLVYRFFLPGLLDTSTLLATTSTLIMPPLLLGSFVSIIYFLMSDPGLLKQEFDRMWAIVIFTFAIIFFWWAFEQAGGSMSIFAADYTDRTLEGGQASTFNLFNTLLTVIPMAVLTWVLLKLNSVSSHITGMANMVLMASFAFVWIIVFFMLAFEWGFFLDFAERIGVNIDPNKTEVQASWFAILNSFFIITFAPLFSKFWEKKIITSGPVKFALGLTLLALGFAFLAWGSASIPQGAKTASISMVWLIMAYLFHTLGELCISPVGLSYVSKLAPVRLIGVMFGVFFMANFIANFAGGLTGSFIDTIVENNSMSAFFLIFTVVPLVMAAILIAIKGFMKKLMHGID